MGDSSKLKEFTDNNFEFDESGRQFSLWVENTVGKGEIARYGAISPFPTVFSKACTADTSKPGLVLERVNQSAEGTVMAAFNSLPDDKILDWSKLKKIADDILKCI